MVQKYKIVVKGILKSKDEFLLVEKWYDDNIANPYQWEFIDGVVNFGESPDDAVLRILEEQTGLVADIDHIAYTWTYMVGDVCNLGIAYVCSTGLMGGDIVLSENLNAYEFVPAEQLDTYITNQQMLKDLRNTGII